MEIDGRAFGIQPSALRDRRDFEQSSRRSERACRLIEQAAATGADAVKIQTYDADSLTIDCDRPEFMIRTPPWEGMNYYQLYRTDRAAGRARPKSSSKWRAIAASRSSARLSTSARWSCCAAWIARPTRLHRSRSATIRCCRPWRQPAGRCSSRPASASIADVEETLRRPAACGLPRRRVPPLHLGISRERRAHESASARSPGRARLPGGSFGPQPDHLAAVLAVARGAVLIEKHFTICAIRRRAGCFVLPGAG